MAREICSTLPAVVLDKLLLIQDLMILVNALCVCETQTIDCRRSLKARGFNGKRTEHQMEEGLTWIDTLRPTRDGRYT